MAKINTSKKIEFKMEPQRAHFKFMLAKNPNYFGNIPGSKIKPDYKLISNTSYEQLTCVGYNPGTANMEATFSIKKPGGFSGNLCAAGSFEHVRFYMDLHDGNGFIDQGMVAINVHDIPVQQDCKGNSVFPIMYVATLRKKTSFFFNCDKPVMPKVRAILSWNNEPPEDSPNWHPVWGSVLDADIQLKPALKFNMPYLDMSDFFAIAKNSPELSMKQIAGIAGIDLVAFNPQPEPPHFPDHVKISEKLKVPASRFAFKSVLNMIKYPTSEITMMDKATLEKAKINVGKLIDQVGKPVPANASKANVEYEELECIGLDFNLESLVATVKIKKNIGYSGDLCSAGSREYISFWIDWDDACNWKYLNTVQLKVHDLQMAGDSLSYSVSIPLDTAFHRKKCNLPNIVRVRGVLSWNVPPSVTDPDQLEYYGNRVDAHIQIKPGLSLDPANPIAIFNIIGGIDVSHVDDATGLTKSGSFFAYNGEGVPTGAPFGGVIVLNGPAYPGIRYRIKITNLSTMASYYATDSFIVVGSLPYDPWVQFTTQAVDSDGYYTFLEKNKNTLDILARFTPGTEDKMKIEMEVEGVVPMFSKTIQMDNTNPVIQLQVDDGGDCTKYKKGDTITGHYYVYDKNIRSWNFGSTWGGSLSGTSNTPGLPGSSFSIPTPANAYPCGAVSLYANDKTIVDSQALRSTVYASYNICLRNS